MKSVKATSSDYAISTAWIPQDLFSALPTMDKEVRCYRCNAKLRATNINHTRTIQGALCDPCADALEMMKLKEVWASRVVTIEKGVLVDKRGSRRKDRMETRDEKRLRDLKCLELLASYDNGLTSRQLSEIAEIHRSTSASKLSRWHKKGWTRLVAALHTNSKPAFVYAISEAGREAIVSQ